MKNLFKSLFLTLAVAGGTFFTSCDNDTANDVLRSDDNPTTGNTTKYNLIVNKDNASKKNERHLNISAAPGKLVTVKTSFKGDKNMYRLYITKHVLSTSGGKEVAYEYPLGKKKKDGSIDLPRQDKKEFSYDFSFDAPANNNEVVQYKLWVTSARGDYRDPANSNAISKTPAAYGTVTIKGDKNVVTNANTVKSFSAFFLKAPLSSKASETFMSVINGKKYQIQDASESVKLWDFGYYYGKTHKASFASASDYPKNIIDIKAISGSFASELNKFYFKKSSKKSSDFDAIKFNKDLDFVSADTEQRIKQLAKGDIIEIKDNYGNKGLIRITSITGTDGSDGKITFDVKIQTKLESIKL